MQSFYTLIYVQTNAAARERLAVGMVMVEPTAEVVRFRYSQRKLSVVGDLVDPGVRTGTRWALDNLAKLFNPISPVPTTGIFSEDPTSNHPFKFTERYLTQIATYQQNVLQYGKVIGIDLPCTEETFDLLYQEHIDSVASSTAISEQRRYLLSIGNRPTIRQHFNRNVRVDSSLVEGVRIPVKVSLLGRNGVAYFGKIIDPYRPVNWLNQDASSFLSLALQTPGDVHYLISQEPEARTHPKQHASWQQFRKVSDFKYIDVSEVEIIEEEARSQGIHKILDQEEE